MAGAEAEAAAETLTPGPSWEEGPKCSRWLQAEGCTRAWCSFHIRNGRSWELVGGQRLWQGPVWAGQPVWHCAGLPPLAACLRLGLCCQRNQSPCRRIFE